MLSPSLEDYLEEIYRFSMHHDIVRVSDIAACLNVTLPSVNNAIRKLGDENYLIYKRYKELELTEKGKKTGKFLVERNHILQEFLSIIKARCDIPAEAEAMEHYLSLPTIRTIESLLDFFKKNEPCHSSFLQYCQERDENNIGLNHWDSID
ncbi:MAG: iron dependent repressor, metal binding and dimerization domain protein [Bacillota bacterium]|nr:iron dependent repressor, metal binding and dimerization domain protein [Bacillota bacterium]